MRRVVAQGVYAGGRWWGGKAGGGVIEEGVFMREIRKASLSWVGLVVY